MTRVRDARQRRLLSTLPLVLLLALACAGLAACGSGSSGSTAGSSSESTGSSSTSEAAVTEGGVLTVGAAEGIPQLNPAVATFAWEQTLWPLLWDGLTQYEEDGSLGPDLATSWKAAKGNKEWTFQLRSGVKFSNGKPFTSADVVANFNYYLKPTTTFFEASQIETIESVKASGPNAVVFKLSSPNAFLPEAITNVKMIYLKGLGTIDKEPVGTGPFVVKSFVPNGALNLVPNSEYWGPAPHVEEIKFSHVSDPTAAFTGLKSGSLDVFWSVPYSDVPNIEADSNLKLIKPAVSSQTNFWDIDNTSPPFNNPKAREALAYVADREAILNGAYFGQGIVSATNDLLTPENPAYDKSLGEYKYEPEKAKKLFEEAGVKKLTWWGVAGNYPEWNTMGQILQANLQEIGVELKIENNDISTWAAKFYPAGKSYPGLIVPNLNTTQPQAAFILNYLLSETCECNYNNPQYDKLYEKALAATSETERSQLWNEMQQMLNKDLPIIVPIQSNVVIATQSNLEGIWAEGSGHLHVENAGFTGS
jgi:peptide/nickel transport system substrate-binding protein